MLNHNIPTMKMYATSLMSMLLALMITNSQAQFLDRLKKEVERSVEDAVIQKSANEAAQKTEQAMDKMLQAGYSGISNMGSAKKVSRDKLPKSYDFDWKYRLIMETKKDDIELMYRLKKGAAYFAATVPSTVDMLMVMDQGRNIMVTYMENEGSKMATALEVPEPEVDEAEEEADNSFTIKKTGNTKEILGYTCDEIVGENEEFKYIMYHTTEPDVTFSDLFSQDQGKLPKGVDEELLKDGVGMMMEMELIDKNKPKDSMKMRCIELSEDELSIDNDDYQFLSM